MRTKRTTRFIALSLGFAVLLSTAQTPAQAGQSTLRPMAVTKKLLWNMEFNTKSKAFPSSAVFNYDLGDGSIGGNIGWGNNEQQFYTNKNVRNNGLGQLVITAKRIPIENGPTEQYPYFCSAQPNEVCPWISSRIQSKGKLGFKYGRLEARMMLPQGDGTWPAFWMLGANIDQKSWPMSGEIDIIEGSGADPFLVRGTAHGPGYSGGEGVTGLTYLKKSIQTGYHTYAIEWTKNKIQWFVDGKVYHTVTATSVKPNAWVFNQEFFIVLNLAIGGWFVGNVVDPTLQQAELKVDWLRFYSVNGVGQVIKHK